MRTMPVFRPHQGNEYVPSTMEHAYCNMEALLAEAGLPILYSRDMTTNEDDGRFAFAVPMGRHREDATVCMPGIPLATLKSRSALPPRLYVNGSSWMWEFAVSTIRELASEAAP